MSLLTNQEKFELWKTDAFETYYKLRDIQLYAECVEESIESLRDLFDRHSKEELSQPAMKYVIYRIKKQFQKVREQISETESLVESKTRPHPIEDEA
jgi:hypothetical protein